jgi:photosystem II stability/assembly factor-like uncharacterized protein
MRKLGALVLLSVLLSSHPLPAQEPETQSEAPPAAARPAPAPQQAAPAAAPVTGFTRAMVDDLAWRNLGPCNPMGRITDLDVVRQNTSVRYVGTAGGGVWKTSNAGTTWQNVFDRVGNVSIGDVAVAPSNPDVVWVGTGEENARNSVQWGDGVYKSTDGGQSFACMGLRESFQIGHIAIHPTNPDIVYVAALGRLWGENQERGVFRTRNGGGSWEKVLFVDDKTGCIDVRVDPKHPEFVYACMYERKRNIYDDNDPSVRFGKGSGLYKSGDGGDNWKQLTNGLPTCMWGRSGIDVFEQNPDTLFLIVETERSGWATGSHKDRVAGDPTPPEGERNPQQQGRGPRGTAVMGIGQGGKDGKPEALGAVLTQLTEGGPAMTAGLKVGDRVTKVDDEDVKTYADLTAIIQDSRADQKVKVTYARGTETATVELTFGRRDPEGGGPFGAGNNGPYSGGRLFGQQENKQKYQGADGWQTGGVFRSDDRGETWKRLNSLDERPFYYSVIRVDPQNDKNIYCVGTTLWASSDGGEKFAGINRGIHVDFHTFWVDPTDSDHLLAGCDGGVNETFDRGKTWQVLNGFCAAQFYDIVADNSVPYNVIGGLQDNGEWLGPSRTRYREGITWSDWRTLWGGDGFGAAVDPLEPWILFLTSQNGALGMLDLRTGNQANVDRERPKEGRAEFNWDAPFVLSPHNRLILWSAGQFVYRSDRYSHLDNRQNNAEQGPIRNRDSLRAQIVSPRLPLTEHGTATAIAESPRVRGLLYVGTDDGALWRGEEGQPWQQIQQNLPAMRGPRYVSDIVPSHVQDSRVYLTLDGHRFDDFRTYVFVSEDRGATWRTLADDLPVYEPCYAVMEDPRTENLLFLGTEYGCYVSLDRGDHWQTFGKDLPIVAVRDLFVQDRDADLVAATHGRGAWVCDIAPLREFSRAVADEDVHLFRPEDAILWRMTSRGLGGSRDYRAPNPPYGATIYLYLKDVPEKPPAVTIHDVTGQEVGRLDSRAKKGLQALQWDARIGNRLAEPGSYSARVQYGGRQQAQAFALYPDPKTTADAGAANTGGEKE